MSGLPRTPHGWPHSPPSHKSRPTPRGSTLPPLSSPSSRPYVLTDLAQARSRREKHAMPSPCSRRSVAACAGPTGREPPPQRSRRRLGAAPPLGVEVALPPFWQRQLLPPEGPCPPPPARGGRLDPVGSATAPWTIPSPRGRTQTSSWRPPRTPGCRPSLLDRLARGQQFGSVMPLVQDYGLRHPSRPQGDRGPPRGAAGAALGPSPLPPRPHRPLRRPRTHLPGLHIVPSQHAGPPLGVPQEGQHLRLPLPGARNNLFPKIKF